MENRWENREKNTCWRVPCDVRGFDDYFNLFMDRLQDSHLGNHEKNIQHTLTGCLQFSLDNFWDRDQMWSASQYVSSFFWKKQAGIVTISHHFCIFLPRPNSHPNTGSPSKSGIKARRKAIRKSASSPDFKVISKRKLSKGFNWNPFETYIIFLVQVFV